MAIARGGADLNEEIGGETRRLRLRNDEIARFEAQHDLGIYVLWDQLIGAAQKPQARHVRDLVALALVGGGMIDVDADKLIDSLGPDQTRACWSLRKPCSAWRSIRIWCGADRLKKKRVDRPAKSQRRAIQAI